MKITKLTALFTLLFVGFVLIASPVLAVDQSTTTSISISQAKLSPTNPKSPFGKVNVTIKVVNQDGKKVRDALVTLTCHYKTKDTIYQAITAKNGKVKIKINIGGATVGYPVLVDVIATYSNLSTTTQLIFIPK